ncbi:MAG TPA: arylamine N-acetyltransferase [Terriglobales bacterium]|nr:arylamine N-acetyltransferase [Terriglobales bacterium]
MNVIAYLEHIGYSGPTAPNAETLRDLHRAHLLTVPFENLDIHWGRTISVDPERAVQKIIDEHRGGFCYELNGAFALLLKTLGFQVTLLSARVPCSDGSDGPEFDHLALRVDLEEPWLADVGFGDSFLEPLRLSIGVEQEQTGKRFRIVEAAPCLRLEKAVAGQDWKTEYLFSLKSRHMDEFAEMCHYHQTSPQSPFTRKKVCSRATADGRITLSEMRLITTACGGRTEKILETEQDWCRVLREEFGIVRP